VSHPPFSLLAGLYDRIMADVDYEAWCEFILSEAGKRGFQQGPVLDLGCGTGNSSIPLAHRGLVVTGLDASAEMLEVARGKRPEIDWRLGEFTTFSLTRRYELTIAVFDSLNNLLTPERFLACATRVYHHLLPGGLFMFDVNTTAGLRDLWEDGRVEGWTDDLYYRWTHGYDPATGLARVEAHCREGARSFTEVHLERPYDADEVDTLLTAAGFSQVEVLRFPDGEPAEADAERIWVCARRPAALP
jgi:ubiquinone/menaquinone biosynthesis C-methylase UbiE